ncbi:MAG: hypothetical protein ACJA2W_000607 [Planctomycetota bacterium]|jgi:hypothetical protein
MLVATMELLLSNWLTLVVLALIIGAHISVAVIVRRMVRRDVKAEDP